MQKRNTGYSHEQNCRTAEVLECKLTIYPCSPMLSTATRQSPHAGVRPVGRRWKLLILPSDRVLLAAVSV